MNSKCLLDVLKEKKYIEFVSSVYQNTWGIKEIECEEDIIADKIMENLTENHEYGEKIYFMRYEKTIYIINKEKFLKIFKKKFMLESEKAKGPFDEIKMPHFLIENQVVDILRNNGYSVNYYGRNMTGAKLYEVVDKEKRKKRIEKENSRKQEIEDFINSLP